jgi:hypothetical protein
MTTETFIQKKDDNRETEISRKVINSSKICSTVETSLKFLLFAISLEYPVGMQNHEDLNLIKRERLSLLFQTSPIFKT